MLEVIVVIEFCLVHPNREEVRLQLTAQTRKRRIGRERVLRFLTIYVGNGPQQEVLVAGQYEAPAQGGKSEHLFLPAMICFYRLAIVDHAAGRLHLFKLIFVREELSEGNLFFTEWRDKDEIELSDIVNSDSRFRFSCASDSCDVELKTEGAIKLFPARDEFQHQVPVLQLPVVRAVQISFFEF